MNKEKNFSLLSQQEIDALVRFLSDKKKTVDSDVMNQNSIDKLIRLILTDADKISLDPSLSYGELDSSLLKKLNFRDSIEESCELRCTTDSDTDFIQLTVFNQKTGESLLLTPKMIDNKDTDEWGYCIPPVVFNHLALLLHLKYTTETHELICQKFAKCNFGSCEHKIPEVFLPENENLIECLL